MCSPSVLFVFQARNVTTGELAAIKVIKLEPGKNLCLHLLTLWGEVSSMHKSRISFPSTNQWGKCKTDPSSASRGNVTLHLISLSQLV